MIEGDVEAAHFIAVESVQTKSKSGKITTKKVKTHVYEPQQSSTSHPSPEKFAAGSNYEVVDDPGADQDFYVVKPKPTKVRVV